MRHLLYIYTKGAVLVPSAAGEVSCNYNEKIYVPFSFPQGPLMVPSLLQD